MMIKYRIETTRYANAEIVAVEVLRETEHCLFLPPRQSWYEREQRVAKTDQFHAFYNTWDEARDALLKAAMRRREEALAAIEKETSMILKISEMSKPNEAEED